MIKNLKSATLLALLFWVLLFVVISIIMFIPQLANQALAQTIITWVVIAIIAFLLGKSYFSKNPGDLLNGAVLAIYWLIIGTILDLIITLPLFVVPSGGSYTGFFSEWTLWVGYAVTIVFVALAALTAKAKK